MSTKSYEEMTEEEREQDIADAMQAIHDWNDQEEKDGKQQSEADFWRNWHYGNDPL